MPQMLTWAGDGVGGWSPVFTGGGHISADAAGGVLVLAPEAAREPAETHAALAVSRRRFGDLQLDATARTVRQLRAGEPNPWEVAWLLWAYTSNTSFYYLALKPNGWELGKEDPAYPGAQRFLATGERPFALGVDHRFAVRHQGNRLRVAADGEALVDLVDEERPLAGGAVGLYCEDAEIMVGEVNVHGGVAPAG